MQLATYCFLLILAVLSMKTAISQTNNKNNGNANNNKEEYDYKNGSKDQNNSKQDDNEKHRKNNNNLNNNKQKMKPLTGVFGICNKIESINIPKVRKDDADETPLQFTKIQWSGGKTAAIKFKVGLKYLCKNMAAVLGEVEDDLRRMMFRDLKTSPPKTKHPLLAF